MLDWLLITVASCLVDAIVRFDATGPPATGVSDVVNHEPLGPATIARAEQRQ